MDPGEGGFLADDSPEQDDSFDWLDDLFVDGFIGDIEFEDAAFVGAAAGMIYEFEREIERMERTDVSDDELDDFIDSVAESTKGYCRLKG